jgi:hypothetical protein
MGWGTRGEGTADRRTLRRVAPLVAAAAGAALVAGAASRRGRVRVRRPGVEPAGPAEPAAEPMAGPARRRKAAAELTEPGAEPGRPAAPLISPARPATPAAEPAGPAKAAPAPVVEPARPAPPVIEPDRPATPVPPVARPAEPIVPAEPTRTGSDPSRLTPPDRPGPPAPLAPAPPAAPRHLGRTAGGRRRVALALVGAAVVAAVGVGMVLASGGDDGPSTATASESPGTSARREPSTTATTRPPTPRQAFALAASRLDDAGSFTYRGTASATDVSVVRPMLWLAVDSTVEGEVSLAGGRLHEVAVATGGRAVETVVDGATVWGRSADRRDRLDDRGYQRVPSLSDAEAPAKGAALLPAWLAAATDHADAGRDELGRRRVAATVPADVFGVIEQDTDPVAATLVVTVDAVGAPVRVEITSAPGTPRLALAYDLAGLGAPVAITPPAPAASPG